MVSNSTKVTKFEEMAQARVSRNYLPLAIPLLPHKYLSIDYVSGDYVKHIVAVTSEYASAYIVNQQIFEGFKAIDEMFSFIYEIKKNHQDIPILLDRIFVDVDHTAYLYAHGLKKNWDIDAITVSAAAGIAIYSNFAPDITPMFVLSNYQFGSLINPKIIEVGDPTKVGLYSHYGVDSTAKLLVESKKPFYSVIIVHSGLQMQKLLLSETVNGLGIPSEAALLSSYFRRIPDSIGSSYYDAVLGLMGSSESEGTDDG